MYEIIMCVLSKETEIKKKKNILENGILHLKIIFLSFCFQLSFRNKPCIALNSRWQLNSRRIVILEPCNNIFLSWTFPVRGIEHIQKALIMRAVNQIMKQL